MRRYAQQVEDLELFGYRVARELDIENAVITVGVGADGEHTHPEDEYLRSRSVALRIPRDVQREWARRREAEHVSRMANLLDGR